MREAGLSGASGFYNRRNSSGAAKKPVVFLHRIIIHHLSAMNRNNVLAAVLVVFLLASIARAATLTVTNANDSGAGSLRDAIAGAANGDMIVFSNTTSGGAVNFYDGAAHTIVLGGTELTVTSSVTITGPGNGVLTVSGNNASRVFNIGTGTTVSMDGLTIANGNDSSGGGILNYGTLALGNCTISGNTVSGGSGGGICNLGGSTVTVSSCTISGNTASVGGSGGGIFNSSGNNTVTLLRSTVSGNAASGGDGSITSGGGVYNHGTLTLIDSTIANNTASVGSGGISQGGGIINFGAAMTLTSCTISGNSATAGPGGIALGGGVFSNGSTLGIVANTIIAGNTCANAPDILNPFASQGHNFIGNSDGGSGFTNGVNGDQVGSGASPIDPKLAPLANNGGPTATMALLPGSPAIDAGDPNFNPNSFTPPLTTDQRGQPRVLDGDAVAGAIVDIGAVEFASSNADLAGLTLSAGTLSPAFAAATTSYTARVSNTNASITLTPTAANGGAKITVNGASVASGSASGDLALDVGANNVFTIVVTAQDGTPKSTTVTVTRNTLPTAPNGTATATTGDQKTITIPFPDTDADGDPVTLLFAPSVAHLTVNSISGNDVTFTPAANYVGDVALGYFVSDDQGDGASGTITVTISDNDAPVIAAHADVSVLAPDLGGVVVNYAAATATDNVSTPTITYSKASGTVFPLGTTTVTITATDAANNVSTATFRVIVHLAAPVSAKQLASGDAAPGAGTNGLPADAKLTSFNLPTIDDESTVAFIAKWTGTVGGKPAKGTGLFNSNTCLAVVGGTAPVPAAKWKSFTDPVVDNNRVVSIAGLAPTAKTKVPASVVVSGYLSLDVIASAGEIAPDATGTQPAGGATFKTFKAVARRNGSIGIFAQLTGGTGAAKATAANDLGLWIKDGADPLKLALRKGQLVGGKTIKTLATFTPGKASPGQGRGWLTHPASGAVLALAVFTDKTQAVLSADAAGNVTTFSKTGDLIGTAQFASYGLPAANDADQTTFAATLKAGTGGVLKTDTRGIFLGDATAAYTTIARVGMASGENNAAFGTLGDPVLSPDGSVAFFATLKGGTAKGLAAKTLWWKPFGQPLELLAQGGQRPGLDLPAEAQWSGFSSLAITDRGPIFAAKLVPKKGGVTPATASGVWACDFDGKPRALFRTGDTINGKKLAKFTLLKATVGNAGVTRSFNNTAQVVWLATFTDKTTAIITTEVP